MLPLRYMRQGRFYGSDWLLPDPRVQLRYAKPTLRWEIWSENGQVTSTEMTVDGQSVDAKYEAPSHSLKFTPLLPLSPGVHKVHCRVTFSNHIHVLERLGVSGRPCRNR